MSTELDMRVGNLIGCKVVKQRGRERYDLVVPGGVRRIDFVTRDGALASMPRFSSSVEDAWLLVLWMRKNGYAVSIRIDINGDMCCSTKDMAERICVQCLAVVEREK